MWKAPDLLLSPSQEKVLKQIAHSRSHRSDHRQRAQLILLFNDGLSNTKAGKQVGLKRHQAGKWRLRWLNNQERLADIEAAQQSNPKEFVQGIIDTLSDLPRSGPKPTFTAEQIALILKVACEDPLETGLPFTQWTLPLLQREVINRGIVKSISVSRLFFFLKSGRAETTQGGRVDSHLPGSKRIPSASRRNLSTLQRGTNAGG